MEVKTTTPNSAIRRRIIFFVVFIYAVAGLSAITFTNIDDFGKWLSAQPANTADAPYAVTLNVGDLGGTAGDSVSVGDVLKANINKVVRQYVSLDLSGSTFTSIGEFAFAGCRNLTGIIIPNSVTSIGEWAFSNYSFTSITFAGVIPSAGLAVNAFYGDLYDKFYATDKTNGTPGTYTKTVYGDTWTRK